MIKIPGIGHKIQLNNWSFADGSYNKEKILSIDCTNENSSVQRKYRIAETPNTSGKEANIQLIKDYVNDCLKLAKAQSTCTIKIYKSRQYIYFTVSPSKNAPNSTGITITGDEIQQKI